MCRCSSSRFWGILWTLTGIGRRTTFTMLCVESIWQIFNDRWAIVICTGQSFLSPAIFERWVPWDLNIKGTSESPTLSVDLKWISTLFSSSILPYLSLPHPVLSVYSVKEVFRRRMAVKAPLSGNNGILGVGWLPHEPSDTFDSVLTPVFDRVLVIVIPSHVLESV